MLNKKTTSFLANKLSNSLIRFNINKKNSDYNNDFLVRLENENTESKNIYKKRGADLSTRNALATINDSKYSLTKLDLTRISLIGQFDKKFCVFYREKDKSIIFFDQHAVHERILYEYYQELLLNEFYGSNSNNNGHSNVNQNDIKLNLFTDIYGKYSLKNNKFSINSKHYNINIQSFNNSFLFNRNSKIQTIFNFSWSYVAMEGTITFYSVPIIFDKIHKIEVLMEIFSYIINNIDNYWNYYINKNRNILIPFDLVIKSKACRNAVKFNDELGKEFMKNMIYELSFCNNPFLCAHGRHNYFIKYKKISN